MSDFEITIDNGRAKIYTPYNAEFVARIKLLSGRWNASDRCWSVPESALEDVRDAMRAIYGRDDRPVADTVNVILRFGGSVNAHCSAVTLLGRTIARAWGRDSGAKPGDGVMFLEGEPDSSGSMRNWYTVVPQGCVVKLLDVPRAAIDQAELPESVTLEIVGATIDRAALEAEKARLLARIAEIDAALAQA